MPPQASSRSLYTGAFFILALANFGTMVSFGSLVLLPLFIANCGGDRADIGILMGALPLASVASRPWVAEMVDRFGRRRLCLAGTITMACASLAYLFFRGDLRRFYFCFFLVRLVHGIGIGLWMTAAFTYVVDLLPANRLNEGVGIFGISGLTGLTFGPMLGEYLLEGHGFAVVFVAASLLCGLATLGPLAMSEAYLARPAVAKASFFHVFRRPQAGGVTAVAVLFGVAIAACTTFVVPYAHEQGISRVSRYYLWYGSTAIVSRLAGGRLADRVGEARIIPVGLLAAALGLSMLLLEGWSPLLAGAGTLSGLGHGLLFPALGAYAVRNELAQIRGRLTGLYTGSIDAGVFMGSIVLGYLGEWFSYRALFSLAAAAPLAALGLFQLSLRWRRS